RREPHRRQGETKHLLGDDDGEWEDLFRLGEDQRGRRMAVEDQLEQHAAAGTGPAAARNGEDLARQSGAAERLMAVDDPTRLGVDATPEAQADVCVTRVTIRAA